MPIPFRLLAAPAAALLLVSAAGCGGDVTEAAPRIDSAPGAAGSNDAGADAGGSADGGSGPSRGGGVATSAVPGTTPGTARARRPEPPVFTQGRRKLVDAGVPDLAAKAYLNASVRVHEDHPECAVPPEVLVAFGRQESDHGRVVEWDDTGHSRTILRGYANTGDDTDQGELDGDTDADWAVGPMQFIPTTWKHFAQDGDGDGKAEPGDYYDSALTAAWHICSLVGAFPSIADIQAAWDQYDTTVRYARAQFNEQHRLWQYRWEKHIYYAFSSLLHPDDRNFKYGLRMWPDPGKEPEFKPPPLPAVASQLIRAAEAYYGPEGEERDNYVNNIAAWFKDIVAATGDPVPYDPNLDKVSMR